MFGQQGILVFFTHLVPASAVAIGLLEPSIDDGVGCDKI